MRYFESWEGEKIKCLIIIKIWDWSSTDYAGGIRFVGGPSEVKGRNKVAAVNPLSNFKCKLKYWSRWPPACSRYSEQRRAAFTMHLHIKWPRPNNTPTHRSTPVELHGISRASLRSTLSHPYSSFRYRAKKKKK